MLFMQTLLEMRMDSHVVSLLMVSLLSGHAARTVVLMSKRERGRRGGVAKGQGRCLTDIFVFRDFCNDHFRLARIDWAHVERFCDRAQRRNQKQGLHTSSAVFQCRVA